MPVAIITGRDFPRMEHDFLPFFAQSPHVGRFFILPEAGAQCLQWDGHAWRELYTAALSEDDRTKIGSAIEACVKKTKLLEGLPLFGERFVQKKAMIAFACLGMGVPSDLKYSWDPGNTRRAQLTQAIAAQLPEYDVVMGGATSIDVTHKGINKAKGVRWLVEHLKIPATKMLYVGDALFPGGNDYVVIETGVQTRSTSGPDQTKDIIDEILSACSASAQE